MALFNTPTNNTTNPTSDERHVVIESPGPVQPRLKQYVAIQNFEVDKKTIAKQNEVVMVTQDTAIPFVSANMLIPLDVAIRQGIYPPAKKPTTVSEKVVKEVQEVVEKVTGIKPASETDTSAATESKSFLGNKLRDAIQAKKVESAKIDANKLAAIKAGGSKK
jgi:hypothetical protein